MTWKARNIVAMHQTVPISRNRFARPLGYGRRVRDGSAVEADVLGLERTPPHYALGLSDERELFEKWNTPKHGVAHNKGILGAFKRRIVAEPVGGGITLLRHRQVSWRVRP